MSPRPKTPSSPTFSVADGLHIRSEDLRWAHLLSWYVLSGDAARLGHHANTMLLVLSVVADLHSGRVENYPISQLARLAGMTKETAIAVLRALQAAGWAERVDGGGERRRAVWRVRHVAPLRDADGQVAGSASWGYAPQDEREMHKALAAGQPSPAVTVHLHQHVTHVHQHVADGGVGIVVAGGGGPTADPDIIGRVVRWLATASVGDRLRWHRVAVGRGAPRCPGDTRADRGDLLAGWVGWVADDLAREQSL